MEIQCHQNALRGGHAICLGYYRATFPDLGRVATRAVVRRTTELFDALRDNVDSAFADIDRARQKEEREVAALQQELLEGDP